jgi:hypothetical protein
MIKIMITLLLTFYVVAAGAAQTIDIATSYTIESKVLGDTRGYSVYLPDTYEQTKAQRFPVLYVSTEKIIYVIPQAQSIF